MSKVIVLKKSVTKFSMYSCTQEEPSSRVTTLCKSHITYMTTLQLRLQTSVLYNVYTVRNICLTGWLTKKEFMKNTYIQ